MVKDKFKYINNFPFIIMVAVAIILIILVNIYLNAKPDRIISFNGYMVLQGDASYNLINKQTINDSLDAEVVQVYNGDYVYKKLDSYFVGVKEKREIDFTYPAYSNDGITLYIVNEDVNLIRDDFDVFEGYSQLSINSGLLYNLGDEEPIDDYSYLFLDLKNSIYINTLSMTIKTLNNEYDITVNSPIYFNTKYINYYSFDGVSFKYNRIDDIYYDSIVKIGNYTLTYEEFLLKMGLIKSVVNDEIIKEEIKEDETNKEENSDEIVNVPYQKPTITIDDFKVGTYYVSSNIKVSDPSSVVTNNPVFDIYDENEKLVLRKKIITLGEFNIKGLLQSTKYHIIGKFEYKNEFGLNVENVFYDNYITTNSIDSLTPINLSSEIGNRYSDKIEIKNLKVLNIDNEALYGITRVAIKVNDVEYNISYSNMNDMKLGELVTISTPKKLKSNTVYDYEIKFYDKSNNELKTTGMYKGMVQTSKETPTLSVESNIKSQDLFINLITNNKDDVYIYDYKYELYSYSGYLIGDGLLNYKNLEENEFKFENLDYGVNYILKVTGIYDLEDGKGDQNLNYEFEFTIDDMNNIVAFYDTKKTVVTTNTINTDLYIKNFSALERENTNIYVYLADKEGNDILNYDGSLKYLNVYNVSELEEGFNSYKKININFENLNSNTEYQIKLKIVVKQLEQDLEKLKILEPNILTQASDAYVEVINSKLFGDTLDLNFNVKDVDNKITDNSIIIEIYEGQYKSFDEVVNTKYIYRELITLDETDNSYVNVTLDNYTSNNYTVFISSNPYDEKRVKTYLEILDGDIRDKENKNYALMVSRDVKATLEIYQQLPSETNKMITELNLAYYLSGSKVDFTLLDCTSDNCTEIGNIYSNGSIRSIDGVVIQDSTNNMLLERGNKIDKRIKITNEKKDKHKLYLTVLKTFEQTKQNITLDDYYILSEIEYDTNKPIYNISSIDDFYGVSNKENNYVATSNLNFNGNTKKINFYGFIDFQGYSLNLYENTESQSNLFNNLGKSSNKNATLKNFVINYEIDFDGVKSDGYGFINYNYGILDNFVLNIKQTNENARSEYLGLVSRYNYGKITNFIVYLNSRIDVYYQSGLLTYQNLNPGVISNGYVATLNTNNKIYTHDNSSRFGTYAYYNTGTIKNVYNLVDIVSLDKGIASTFVYSNSTSTAVLRNTLSVANITKVNESGPNVYSNSNNATSINNFYYDSNNLSFSNKYNQKINKTALRNTGVLEVILNSDIEKGFSIISGYYPTVNLSSFMKEKQQLIPISFNYTETIIDIVSTEIISQNKSDGSAEIGVYISNPDKLNINSIDVADISNEEILNVTYDESTQITYLTLKIKLQPEDPIKSVYEINSFKYEMENAIEKEKEYVTNKPRIQIDMYRPVKSYSDLVQAINSNENIFLVNDISYDGKTSIPKDVTYTSILDGNQKILNLNNVKLPNGYFIYYVLNGVIKNLQISNMKIDIDEKQYNSFTNKYAGFIRYSNQATFENIDMSDSNITIENADIIIYSGNLVGISSSSTLNKISINNSIINVNQTGINTFAIGGIVGYQNSSSIDNSYVYNIKINGNYDKIVGIKTIGGIAGTSYNALISNSYTYGSIKSNSSYVGGIIGFSNYGSTYSTSVSNSYSFVNITSTGNYLGGIVGTSGYVSKIKNNMFVGKINNINYNTEVSTIVPNSTSAVQKNNYDLGGTSFIPTITYKEFDINNTFSKEESILPYLKETSFVDQKIKNISLQEDISREYKVEYIDDKDMITDDKTLATSAYLYLNSEISISEGYNKNKTLKIEKEVNDSLEYNYKYKVTPNNEFVSIYIVEFLSGEDLTIAMQFYRKINNWDDWKGISTTSPENVIILGNLVDTPSNTTNLVNKKLNNVICNNGDDYCKISGISNDDKISISKNLIFSLSGTMSNIEFSNIILQNNSNYTGIIGYNTGKINNCKFNNITVSAKNRVGIIGFNNGYVGNISINNISLSGKKYIGGLIGWDYNFGSKIENIKAENIEVNATDSYSGGLVGFINSVSGATNTLINSSITNSTIKGTSYVGGMLGYSQTGVSISNNIVTNLTVDGSGIYIGGFAGYIESGTNLRSIGVNIINTKNTTASYVGGIVGLSPGVINISSTENLFIGTKDDEENINGIRANYVGGISGSSNRVINSYVRNSTICAKNHVGGILGAVYSYTNEISENTVSKTDVIATDSNAGGLIGYYYATSHGGRLSVKNNAVISNSGENYIQSSDVAGGIIGYIKNNTDFMQNFEFSNNFVENYTILVTNEINSNTSGGLIGKLYKVPNSLDKKFQNSLFYGNIDSNDRYGVGTIDNFNHSASYGDLTNEYEFSKESGFKQFVLEVIDLYGETQISDETKINYSTSYEKLNGYFPILSNYTYKYDDVVIVPKSNELLSSTYNLFAFSRRTSFARKVPINLDYEVYASDVNKLNIEFSGVDETVNFYYQIGDYTSNVMPVNKNTFTITYDFKTPIKIYLFNSSTSQNKTYEAVNLSRNISIVNKKTYYIKNNILYSEDNAIKGKFVNLYGNKALNTDGTIYNILDKTATVEPIDYNILINSVPLYKFNYNGANIETYYNYSIVEGIKKDYQIFIKKNNLSVIDNSLNNKKNSYLIDFYNNKEIQLVLNNDNKIYNLKGEIKYPDDIVNESIKDIYNDINSDSNLITIEYKNGEIYTFNYLTGEKVFSNKYSVDMNLMEYLSAKLSNESKLNKIDNISSTSKYEEVEKMKEKLTLYSVEDAKNLIYENNSQTNKNNNYIVIYNPVVQKYDIYDINELISNKIEPTSENDEIYKDYELVQFYNNSNKKQENNSLNGILIFALTILSILTTLYLLINRKRMRRAI